MQPSPIRSFFAVRTVLRLPIRTLRRRLSAQLAVVIAFCVFLPAALAGSKDIAPETAVSAMVKMLSEKPLVALGERHGVQEMADFYLALVTDERFRERADVIVLEIANARYQPLIDAYISGSDVSLDEIRPVWRDGQAHFYRAATTPALKNFSKPSVKAT